MHKDLVEKVAKVLHDADYEGLSDDEYEQTYGVQKKKWRVNEDAPFDIDPSELAEHQREGYRYAATMVLEFLNYNGLLRL